jgi:hypothetical protein
MPNELIIEQVTNPSMNKCTADIKQYIYDCRKREDTREIGRKREIEREKERDRKRERERER